MKDFSIISVVKNQEGKGLVVESNPTDYPLIAKGKHGAIFKLSDDQCVKIFFQEKTAAQEADAYKRINGSIICPKLYEVGPKYIIIEYIEGLTLSEYLEGKEFISKSLTKKILLLLQEIKKLGFTNIDMELQNTIITKDGVLRLVDLACSFYLNSNQPKLLFKDLEFRGLLDLFMKQVKKINFQTYLEMKSLHKEFIRNRSEIIQQN
ncbi:MAG: hypothetical protein N4A57_13610 [Anaeromicrobium sp.]|jgi:RIO-like serine/threonine protein kinase|uniref:hypothetical protein n=1 Tax=Anaeromicrobium sp. TaxID=1929132 RepID=UPI0025DBD9A7|nr:hypothetical protein [Anaeromicrobium sp.]MCT4595281.1 hypothetical protein [Anaeromicrobium sp.]